MKKVLIIINALTGGGMEEVALGILEAAGKDFQIDMLTFYERDISQAHRFEAYGCRIYQIPKVSKNIVKFIFNCRKIIKDNNYEYVHTMIDFNGVLVCLAALKTNVKKVICQSHSNTWTRVNNPIIKKIIQRSFQLLPCTLTAVSKESGERLFGKGKKEIIYAKNGINLEKYKYDSAIRDGKRRELGVTNKLVVGNVGRLAEQKNHEKQVEIVRSLLDRYPEMEYWMIGDGENREWVKKLIVENKLENSVKLMSHRNDVSELLQAMDVFLLPSLFEGFPVSLVEAQCSGLLCIVSNNVPLECNITGNVYYFDLNESAEQWASKIEHAYINHIRKDQSMVLDKEGFNCKKSYNIYLQLMD